MATAHGYIVCRFFTLCEGLCQMSKPTVTYGADPEFFVRERATGTIVPSCGLFGGDKGSPIVLSGDGGYLEDGVTIELNVAPQDTVVALRDRLLALKALWEQRFPGYELVPDAFADFTRSTLRKHPQAMAIGCNADLCAWGIRRAPQISDFGPRRFAGGHIHVGLDPWPQGLDPAFVIRWLDVFALYPTLRETGVSVERFEHYGRPGLYRTTPYGVEWRSPDPFWVVNRSPVAKYAQRAVEGIVYGVGENLERMVQRFHDYVEADQTPKALAPPVLTSWKGWTGLRGEKSNFEFMDWVLYR